MLVFICLFGEQGLKQCTIGSCCALYLACPEEKFIKFTINLLVNLSILAERRESSYEELLIGKFI